MPRPVKGDGFRVHFRRDSRVQIPPLAFKNNTRDFMNETTYSSENKNREKDIVSAIHGEYLDAFRKLQPLAFLGSLSLVFASFTQEKNPLVSESASFAGLQTFFDL